MFEQLFSYLCSYAPYSHYFLFILLLLTGFYVPICEELIMISGGILVSLCAHEQYTLMLVWLYLGCILAAYETYWLGYHFGHKLYTMRFFRHIVTRERIEKCRTFIERYGLLTFLVGRFCPGGVRNMLYLTSGMGRIPFPVFVYRDGLVALLYTFAYFQLGYLFGENYPILVDYVTRYHHVALLIVGTALGVIVSYLWIHRPRISS